MLDFFKNIFSLDGFPPRWFCGTWPESLGYLHITADLTIFLAYMAIPITIIYFIMQRKDIPFPPIFWLFGGFILLCGLTHLVEASMFWYPWYRFSGLMKVCTALISVATAIALIRITPKVLQIPAAKKNLENLIQATPLAIAMVSTQRSIDYTNAKTRELFGYSEGELSEKTVFCLIHEVSYPTVEAFLVSMFEQQKKGLPIQVDPLRITGVDRNKNPIPLEINANFFASGNEEPQIILTFTDLTDKEALEKENKKYLEYLEESNSELEDFSRVVSHDLKEPIRGIKNYTTLIKEEGDVGQDSLDMLEAIAKLSDRLQHMITELLAYSVLGKTRDSISNVDLKETLEHVKDTIHPIIKTQNVTLTIQDDLPVARCDKARISQVFYNLITNAIKYNVSKAPRVDISYETLEDQGVYHFKVTDNGIGIKERNLESVFVIFKRLHSRHKYGGGTGAGLTMAKKMIEKAGGKIWVTSVFGEGSTFHFTIPMIDNAVGEKFNNSIIENKKEA